MGYELIYSTFKIGESSEILDFQRFWIIQKFFNSYSFMNLHTKVLKELLNAENSKKYEQIE